MHKLRLDDFQVDSFATTETPLAEAALATQITIIRPYSMLGSCYGCYSEFTVCATGAQE